MITYTKQFGGPNEGKPAQLVAEDGMVLATIEPRFDAETANDIARRLALGWNGQVASRIYRGPK